MKPYLLVVSSAFGTRESVCDWLDTRAEIVNWIRPVMQNLIIITSNKTAFEIGEIVRQRYPGNHFLVAEIASATTDGWMSKVAWEHIHNPNSAG